MRKTISIIATSALLVLGNVAFADDGDKSGVFVGAHSGISFFGLGFYDEKGRSVGADKYGESGAKLHTSFNIGFNIGYHHFFTSMFGVRGYLGYDINGSRVFIRENGNGTSSVNISFHNITLNADALVDLFSVDDFVFGAYLGFGLGYGIAGLSGNKSGVEEFMKTTNYGGFNIPLNVGTSVTFGEHHRVELGGKFQTLTATYTVKGGKSQHLINTHLITLGYSYVF